MFPKYLALCCVAMLMGACATTVAPNAPQHTQATKILSEKEELDFLNDVYFKMRTEQVQYLKEINMLQSVPSEQWDKPQISAKIKQSIAAIEQSIDDLNALPLRHGEVDLARKHLIQGQRIWLLILHDIDSKEYNSKEDNSKEQVQAAFWSNMKAYMQSIEPYLNLLQKYGHFK